MKILVVICSFVVIKKEKSSRIFLFSPPIFFFFLMIRPPPSSTLFPSPPLSQSQAACVRCPLRGARTPAASHSDNVFRARPGARQANPRRWVRRQGHLLLRQEWPRDAEHSEG